MADVTLTVRLIRSFEHRNLKHLVYHNVDLFHTTKEFINFVITDVKTRKGILPPFRNHPYDTLKIEHKAFAAKTNDPVINRDNDETLILKMDQSLSENGVEHETVLSLFKLEDYKQYKETPKLKW